MFARTRPLLWLVLIALLALAACNYPAAPATQDPNAVYTAAAQTLMAQLTQGAPLVTDTPAPDVPTATQAAPTDALLPTATPTATTAPTATSAPATATSAPTATPVPCLWAYFVEDVTIPDGQNFPPSTDFVKTWRLRNRGSCTWTTDFRLVFVRGANMGPASVRLPRNVAPGENVNISIDLTAPAQPGTYRGYYMLSDGTDVFGIGASAESAFWVEIDVVQPEQGMVYNFARNACSAEWISSNNNDLPCPGRGVENTGFVVILNEPRLEHRTENEPAIWTNPAMENNGFISGSYPELLIRTGDRFLADIGCLAANPNCDVLFQLHYRIGGGATTKLGEWREVYDQKVTRVDIDLSSLNGQRVEFILTVTTNGPYNQDAAFWLQPHIRRP